MYSLHLQAFRYTFLSSGQLLALRYLKLPLVNWRQSQACINAERKFSNAITQWSYLKEIYFFNELSYNTDQIQFGFR